MVSNARTRSRGIMALSLFVFCLILLTLPASTEARVQLKIETSIEGDPGDGVLSPSGSGVRMDPEPVIDDSGIQPAVTPTPSYAPYRLPFLFIGTPTSGLPMLWLDSWSNPFPALTERRWFHVSGSRN